MKLRNKKTGEIIEGKCFTDIVKKLHDRGDPICSRPLLSIALFEQYWKEIDGEDENVLSKEPLIKDGKIRRAVRAWAEANGYEKDEEYEFEDFSTGWKSWSLEHKTNGDYNEIHFNGGIDFDKMNHQGYYTIAELCGEEEE